MAYATVEQSRVLILKAATLTDLQKLQKKTINVKKYYDHYRYYHDYDTNPNEHRSTSKQKRIT